MTDSRAPASGVQSLSRGLQILRTLIDEGTPLTGTEIARRFDLHQSSISRVLATLIDLGYVRKAPNGKFVPDYGILTFAPAIAQFPLVTKPRIEVEAIAAEHPGFSVHLCLLWRTDMIYLLRANLGNETITFWGPSFPLHVSTPAMRLLLELPQREALDILELSRQRFGWRGPKGVPQTMSKLLAKAKSQLSHDVLILDEWSTEGFLGGAIPLQTDEGLPVALAITGRNTDVDYATLRLWLHEARRRVESTLT